MQLGLRLDDFLSRVSNFKPQEQQSQKWREQLKYAKNAIASEKIVGARWGEERSNEGKKKAWGHGENRTNKNSLPYLSSKRSFLQKLQDDKKKEASNRKGEVEDANNADNEAWAALDSHPHEDPKNIRS